MVVEQGGLAPTVPDLYKEVWAQFCVGISSSKSPSWVGTATVWSSLLGYAFQSVDQEYTLALVLGFGFPLPARNLARGQAKAL